MGEMSPGQVFLESSEVGLTCLAEPPSFQPPPGSGWMRAETQPREGGGQDPS